MAFQLNRRDFVATLAAIPILPDALRASYARRAPALVAKPFELNQVRLLPGVFRDDVDINRKYMMGLDVDRMLVSFRTTAGLPTSAEPYYGWEAPNNELRGHFVGHYVSGCALCYAQTGDAAVKARGDQVVAELAKCQNATGYLSAFPQEVVDRLKARRGAWAPFYTLHKIMAGMIDSYTLTGNIQALDVAKRMAAWTRDWVAPVDDATMQRILNTEFGGIGESLENLAAITGDPMYRDVAKRFDHERILAPLAAGRDELTKVHANTTIPKIIAAARRYELTGDQRSHDIATFFWHDVTEKRSFCTGGSSSGENYKGELGKLSTELAWDTEESCVTYNMLKLTRQIFSWTADASAADYYERALFNSMLGTQHPSDGEKIYYKPLLPGYWKMFGTPDHGFWCCHGSGVESHSKFGDSIYFHDDEGIWVNQFIASDVNWQQKGVRLVQETTFPTSESTRITVHAERPTRMALRIRTPYWVAGQATLKLNGKRIDLPAEPGKYFTVNNLWKNGDHIDVVLPMNLHLHPMPDDPTLQAVMYGPLVLAGKLGRHVERAEATKPRMSPDFTPPQIAEVAAVKVPAIIAKSPDVNSWVKRVPGAGLQFTTVGQATPTLLAPFNAMYDERYVVYWKVGGV